MFYLLLVYGILINFLAFVIFGIDKRKASRKKYRISENVLLILTALGGFLGAILGMIVFHHKTVKSSFQWKFWLLVFVWIGLILFYIFD